MRGFMATKYLNFVTRKRVSAGLAFGEAWANSSHYVRSFVSPGNISFNAAKQYEHVVPLLKSLRAWTPANASRDRRTLLRHP